MQLPPLFSALKMNGKPLYEYAREGKPIPREIERREVEVLDLEMLEWMEGDTHRHEAPTEEAGYAEVNVANQLWAQEKALPAGGVPEKAKLEEKTSTGDELESKKRKLGEGQDELVVERPASKQQKSTEEQTPTMSGALDPASSTPPPEATSTETQPEAINESSSEQAPTSTEAAPEAESKSKGPPAARIRMTVTSGFYVRSLCHDLGAAVGSAAIMAELVRSRQGQFELGKGNVFEYSDLEKGEDVWGPKIGGLVDEWEAGKSNKSAKTEVTGEDISTGEAKATEGEQMDASNSEEKQD